MVPAEADEVAPPAAPLGDTTPTMLDSHVVRRKKEKGKRPEWGVPTAVVL
ncbi:hypothetical protein Slala05_51650 [Streptomyces lavendulae subsp. lavendulae]|nr:hypothetical protein Slala05_51650 [Streptomyces lavendulae subsp. lavendulae]